MFTHVFDVDFMYLCYGDGQNDAINRMDTKDSK